MLTFRELLGSDNVPPPPATDAPESPAAPPHATVQVIGEPGEKTQEDDDLESRLHKSRMESLALVAGGVAHDFNNILTTISSSLSMAQCAAGEARKVMGHIENAMAASQGAKQLTEKLLTYVKGGGQREKRERANIAEILADAVKLSTFGANVRCEQHVAEDLWSAEIERTAVTQVINNLLINARQAMDDSGTIQAYLENIELAGVLHEDLAPGKYVRLRIIDHGCGIPKAHLDKIFESFYTTKESGTGLGLATCFAVVRGHEGLITVDSTEGAGTEFCVYLPATGEAATAAVVEKSGKIYPGEGRILLIDDLLSIRAVTQQMLTMLGYEVTCVEDGESAVKVYRQAMIEGKPFALVLTDITLPGGMNGFETTSEIRRLDPFSRVVAISGYFKAGETGNPDADSFDGILPKPYELQELSEVVHHVLERD